MVSLVRAAGMALAIGLVGVAAFLATTPWRVHGGRFAAEYLLLAGVVGLIGSALLIVLLWWR